MWTVLEATCKLDLVLQERPPELWSRADGRLTREGGLVLACWAVVAEVRAPITGTVIRIDVSEGSRVRQDEPLAVLESMKMQVPVESPVTGRVLEVRASEGQAVEEDEVLFRIE